MSRLVEHQRCGLLGSRSSFVHRRRQIAASPVVRSGGDGGCDEVIDLLTYANVSMCNI